jgi:hypothetical protein
VHKAKNIESLLCVGVSLAAMEVIGSVGLILTCGAVCLCVTRMYEIATEHNHDVAMRDAVVRIEVDPIV